MVDLGCAECKLLKLLKKEDYIEELVGVDIDSVPLEMHSNLVEPLITDYLHPRPRPLYAALMQGAACCFQHCNRIHVSHFRFHCTGGPQADELQPFDMH